MPVSKLRLAITNFHKGHTNSNTLSGDLTYLLTPRCRVLLEKLTGLQLVKKFPAFYGTRRFITASQASATCPHPGPAQSSPHTHILPPGDPSYYYPPIYA